MNAPEPESPGRPYQGGIYAGRFFVDVNAFALIAAPRDEGDHDATPLWGGTKVGDALSYCDGYSNTEAMAAAGSALGKWARGLRVGGFHDWYLPSRLEALILFGGVRKAADLAEDWYWTSTQYAGGAQYAWCHCYFDHDNQFITHMDLKLRARAVRRVPTIAVEERK